MIAKGVVESTDGDRAFVLIDRQNLCETACVKCGGCNSGKAKIQAINAVGARGGESVTVKISVIKGIFGMLPRIVESAV
ncbi:MAG: SoxR reducing system RseC family protein [Clostridiales bacterium]|nr:SoxR reducing system RseC family protein [Clostridiales bacterium]